jgi:hypothetical protein
MHRILSDLSPLLSWRTHPFIVAGDFNNAFGGSVNSCGANWTDRNAGVFSRMVDLGLRLAMASGSERQPGRSTATQSSG